MTPRRVGLVADDLTGATDSAVPFADAGWSAHVLRGPAGPEVADGRPAVLAVVTGTRPLADDAAARRTAAAVRDLVARGCDRLYLKIDSTVRGAVAGQVRGALHAWAQAHPGAAAALCPAFPAHGRTVVEGRVLVGGLPVARSAAAADPVTPVADSRLDHLVPGALPAIPAALGPEHAGAVAILDAATDTDLDAIAARLDALGPAWLAVGSAGLAGALARRWSRGPVPAGTAAAPAERILVGVSSLHPVAQGAARRLRGAPTGSSVYLLTTPAARGDAAAVAADFGDRVAEEVARTPYDALVLVGGDGAAAALDRIGATAVAVHAALLPGVPVGAVVGGPAHGVRVVTTSGGFGDADSLLHIVRRLQSGAPQRKVPS